MFLLGHDYTLAGGHVVNPQLWGALAATNKPRTTMNMSDGSMIATRSEDLVPDALKCDYSNYAFV